MEILYSDRDLIVCIKPVGLDSEKEVPAALLQQFPGQIYPLHRLDQNVGGVMVYARTKACAATLSKAIQNSEMVKEYVAMVHGTPPENGEWTDYLFKDSRKNKVFAVKRPRTGVKEAKLAFCRLEEGEQSLVQVRLYTGRSHQIRVQFSSRGFPLVGDHKYGSRASETAPMLYSCRLTFPYQNKTFSYSSLPLWASGKKLADF